MKYITIIAVAFSIIPKTGFSEIPAQWIVDLDHGTGSVEFRAIGHPSALKIIGKGSAPRGKFTVMSNNVKGTALFDLSSLDTGIALRTNHMKENYLETSKYQEAKLTLSQLSLPTGSSKDHFSFAQIPFTGTLLLHGIEKPVSGTASLERSGNKLSIKAEFSLKISEFQMGVPSFAGITMAEEVHISVVDSAPVL